MSDEVSNQEEGQTPQTTNRDSGEEGYQSQPDTQGNETNTQEADSQEAVAKPAWLPEKFETPEQLAHSYKEMEGKLHTRREDFRNSILEELGQEASSDVPAPGDYALNINSPEGTEVSVADDDPMVGWFREKAHDFGLSQEDFDSTINEYFQMDQARGPDWNQEVQELGEHGERRLERVDTWASANLSEEAYNKFSNIRADAATVKLFEELMELNGQPQFNMTSDNAFQEVLDLNDLKAMQNDPKYWRDKDPSFVNKVQVAFEQYSKRKGSNVN